MIDLSLAQLHADIAEADAEFERGEYYVESPEFWAIVEAEANRMIAEGIAPDPKVCPPNDRDDARGPGE